jgi:Bacterial type II and III secretion system protein
MTPLFRFSRRFFAFAFKPFAFGVISAFVTAQASANPAAEPTPLPKGQVVQSLKAPPPQLTIEAKIFELSEDEEGALDILRLLGVEKNILRPMPARAVVPRPTPLGKDTPLKAPGDATTQMIRADYTNLPPACFTSIVTASQYCDVLNLVLRKPGADTRSAHPVATLSGRQVQIKIVNVKSLVTGLDTGPDGVARLISEPFEIGTSLDVIPEVQADGYTIQMTVSPSIREFAGYEEEVGEQSRAGITATKVPPLMFRVRQVTSRTVICDGQTVVVGAGTIEVDGKPKTRADGADRKVRKILLAFVTPTIIDPAGNRVHPPEDFSLRNTHIPPQKLSK